MTRIRRDVKLQAYVSEEMAEYVRTYAEGYDVTVSDVIRWAISDHMNTNKARIAHIMQMRRERLTARKDKK